MYIPRIRTIVNCRPIPTLSPPHRPAETFQQPHGVASRRISIRHELIPVSLTDAKARPASSLFDSSVALYRVSAPCTHSRCQVPIHYRVDAPNGLLIKRHCWKGQRRPALLAVCCDGSVSTWRNAPRSSKINPSRWQRGPSEGAGRVDARPTMYKTFAR